MRRNNTFRGLASALSIWLAICLSVPMQLHTCVMHAGLAMDVSPAGESSALHSHHGVAQGARESASSQVVGNHPHHQHGTDGQSKQCSCLGDCSTGKTPIGLAATTPQLLSVSVQATTAGFSYTSPSLIAAHFLLPFPNGPPDASSRA